MTPVAGSVDRGAASSPDAPAADGRVEYRILLRKASAKADLFEQHLNELAGQGWRIRDTVVRKNRFSWTEELEVILERAVP